MISQILIGEMEKIRAMITGFYGPLLFSLCADKLRVTKFPDG